MIKPSAKTFLKMDLKLSDIRNAVKKMLKTQKRHDWVDTDGNIHFDLNTGKKFCWKHGNYE